MKNKGNFIKLDLNQEMEKIGIRLRQIRKSLGYSSHETFAYEKGLDRAQYGKYEAGGTNITLRVLIKILNAMEVSLSEFFNEDYNKIILDGSDE